MLESRIPNEEIRNIRKEKNIIVMRINFNDSVDYVAVSYTHLDVYKRQVISIAMLLKPTVKLIFHL